MRDVTAKHLSSVHTFVYRASRGRIGRRLVDNDMLLLSTIGRKSGRMHTVPLLYLRDDDDYVVIASWGGRDDHPHWYLNLLAEPRATLQIRHRRVSVRARTATRQQRDLLWSRILEAYDGYRIYQGRTGRQIPVVILTAT